MPRFILKTATDSDLYVEWSTVVDNLVAVGDREWFISEGNDPERLDRADKTGTSCKGFEREGDGYAFGAYDDNGFILHNMETRQGFRWLPRKNLHAYAEAVMRGDMDVAEGDEITEPCDDD